METRPSRELGHGGDNGGADKVLGTPGERDSSGPTAGPVTGIASSFPKKSGFQLCQLPEDSEDSVPEGEGDGFVVRSPLSEPDPFSSVTAGGDVQKRRLKRLQPLSLHGISFLTPHSHGPG